MSTERVAPQSANQQDEDARLAAFMESNTRARARLNAARERDELKQAALRVELGEERMTQWRTDQEAEQAAAMEAAQGTRNAQDSKIEHKSDVN